ncbi:MAG: hypothetical protein AAFW00_28280 [Bacteroidota bacterium]
MLSPSPYNLLAEIDLQRKSELLEVLCQIDKAPQTNSYFHFHVLPSVHFGRFVVLDEVMENGQEKYPAYLAFSTNYDGTLDDHLREIIQHNPAGVATIFGFCKDFPGTESTVAAQVAFFKRNGRLRPYFYRGNWNLTVDQIQKEDHYRKETEALLDAYEHADHSAEAVRDFLVEQVPNLPDFQTFSPREMPLLGLLQGLTLGITGIFLLSILLPLTVILRLSEWLDREINKTDSTQKKTYDLANKEDLFLQNQITHLVEVKKGWFRRRLLKFVLSGLDWLSRYIFNKGSLGGITSIHYARWILIDKGRRLLFFSNFDGSWESYLGEFVDRAAVGLTGVWSNTKGFPKTKFLLFKGARDEQRFKAWVREQQIPTQVWYSAYPHLTVQNIRNNHEIHNGLIDQVEEHKNISPKAMNEWLEKY